MGESKITTIGDIGRLLANLQAKLEDLTPVNQEISEILLTSVHENFLVKGRYSSSSAFVGGSSKWKDLSDVTKKARKKIGKWPGQLLRVSGRLFNSITTKATSTTAEIGTNLEYAALQQFGARKGGFGKKLVTVKAHTKKMHGKTVHVKSHQKYQLLPWGNIPARPFLVVQEEDLENIGGMIFQRLLG